MQCQKAAADIAESKAKTAVLEERLRAETVLRLTQNELTKSQSHRAKLEAVCAVSGDLHPQVDEPGEVAGATATLKITRVQRAAKVTEAWAAVDKVPWKHVTREAEQGNEPRMPCLAATTTDGRHFTANVLRADGLATKTSKIKPGTHVFVKVHGEPHIRYALAFVHHDKRNELSMSQHWPPGTKLWLRMRASPIGKRERSVICWRSRI